MNDSDVVECNGSHIAELRRSLNWTQAELAGSSGYSLRLVRKAEQNGTLRFSTIIALATAFQRKGLAVSAADLCTDPVAVAQTFVEAYRVHEAKMVDQIRHVLSDDLAVFVAGDPSQIPFAGTFEGPEGLQEFWNRFFALIERHDKTSLNLQYFVCGHEVVAYGTERGRIRGHTTDQPTWLCLKFEVRNGQIVRFEDYFDTASAQAHIAAFQDKLKRQDS